MRQSWQDLLFAHWPIPASSLQQFVPSGVSIQEFDGTSWVGIVPFRMEGVMLRPLPDLPWISAFPELNLRLYVEVEGKAGVWFVSLDAANPLAVCAARRFFHLPYFHAKMQVSREANQVSYTSLRCSEGDPVSFKGRYQPTSSIFEAKAGTLEHFLTERYCLYTQTRNGTLLRAEIHHWPWPLQTAEAELEENAVAQPQGIALKGPPTLLHYSRRLDVVVWPPQKVQ